MDSDSALSRAETPIRLRVCALENADRKALDGEYTDGLYTDGEYTDGE
jgi:hypothetical protein